MLSLQSLRTPPTRTQVLDFVLGLLNSLGFATTGWQEGRIQHSLVKLFATLGADFAEVAKLTAEMGSNETAFGAGLTEYSWSRYRNRRIDAVATAGPMRLYNSGAVPYTVQPGELIAATDTGIEYRNTTGGTISAGTAATPSETTLQWSARIAGSGGNAGDETITRLLTPLAGVTVSNDVATPWYTTAGVDEESDAALKLRNSTKWARLTVELVKESYINIALENGARKVAVNDQNPRGAGTIDVIVAADNAVLGTSEMDDLQAVFATHAFQTSATRPADADSRVTVLEPSTIALGVTATVYHRASVSSAEIVTRCVAALDDFVNLTPIGGWDYSPGPANVVTVADVYDVLKSVEGVLTVTLTTPAANVSVGTLQLVTPGSWASTITATPVTA